MGTQLCRHRLIVSERSTVNFRWSGISVAPLWYRWSGVLASGIVINMSPLYMWRTPEKPAMHTPNWINVFMVLDCALSVVNVLTFRSTVVIMGPTEPNGLRALKSDDAAAIKVFTCFQSKAFFWSIIFPGLLLTQFFHLLGLSNKLRRSKLSGEKTGLSGFEITVVRKLQTFICLPHVLNDFFTNLKLRLPRLT